VTTTSARGRPIFGMPLLDHKSEISPSDFVSRGLEAADVGIWDMALPGGTG
jgi:hypothetical protein